VTRLRQQLWGILLQHLLDCLLPPVQSVHVPEVFMYQQTRTRQMTLLVAYKVFYDQKKWHAHSESNKTTTGRQIQEGNYSKKSKLLMYWKKALQVQSVGVLD
jgi:hypothetical protein